MYKARFFLLILAVSLISLHSPGFAKKKPSIYGVISFINGDVKIIKNKQSIPAQIGQKVETGDTIITLNGTARIQIADSYLCQIDKHTTVEFKNIAVAGNKDIFNLNLNSGRIFSRLVTSEKKPANVYVKTPTFTAGVRGTDFLVSVNDKPVSKNNDRPIPSGVYVTKGIVEVQKTLDRQKVSVNAGEEVVVSAAEMKKSILEDFIKTRMQILEELKIMKEYNCRILDEQKEKNRKLLEEFQ